MTRDAAHPALERFSVSDVYVDHLRRALEDYERADKRHRVAVDVLIESEPGALDVAAREQALRAADASRGDRETAATRVLLGHSAQVAVRHAGR